MKRLLLLLSLAAFGVTMAQDAPARSDIRIVVVVHGGAADPFWSVVKNGVDQAAQDTGVTVEYRAPDTFDMPRMAQLIDAAVASQPDGLIVSVPDADALGDSISAAMVGSPPTGPTAKTPSTSALALNAAETALRTSVGSVETARTSTLEPSPRPS